MYLVSSRAYAVVHQVCQGLAACAFEHAVPQRFVGMPAILPGASAPIGYIVRQATIAPQRPVFEIAVREQAAAVAREVMELSGRGGSYGEKENSNDQNYWSGRRLSHLVSA